MDAADMKQVEALIRKRVRESFVELTGSAAHLLKDAVEMAARELIPAEPDKGLAGLFNKLGSPEPVNPFAPKLPADQWAVILRSTIDAAEKDGHDVWIKNDCCGCSRMTLEVGSETEHVRVIGDSG